MQRIDAHQHFWRYHPVRDSWITEDMSVIQADFLPADLEPLLQQHQIDGCVLVQSDQTEVNNLFMLQLATENDFIKGVVGWIDLQADDIEARLQHFSSYKKLKGFRHVLQGETQRDFMLRSAFKKGISLLSQFGYTYDILIYPDQLNYSQQLVSSFPNQLFVIDHLAKPYINKREIKDWKADMQQMAAHPNVYCKLSGMVTEGDWKDWKNEDFFPYLDVVVNAFGTDRIMFGSDWPVCLLAATYGQVLQIVESYFSSFSEQEKEAVFGGNAIKFYQLT